MKFFFTSWRESHRRASCEAFWDPKILERAESRALGAGRSKSGKKAGWGGRGGRVVRVGAGEEGSGGFCWLLVVMDLGVVWFGLLFLLFWVGFWDSF